MCWGQFARQAFARLTADEHGQIVSVAESKWLKFSGVANVTTKNDCFVHSFSVHLHGGIDERDGASAK